MNHQITLEEMGLIPKTKEAPAQGKATGKDYAFPCGGCICNHCANSTECSERQMGEADFGCFVCEDCRWYDGKGTDSRRDSCSQYKITNQYADRIRKSFKTVKTKSEVKKNA